MKMKKALAWIAAMAMLLTAFSGLTLTASAATLSTKTYNMTQLDGYYHTQGRVERVNDVLCMDTAASGFEFYYYGKGDLTSTMFIKCAGGSVFFSVIVDGVESRVKLTASAGVYTADVPMTLATSLSEGYHHVQVYKQNGADKSNVHIGNITMTGYPVAAPAKDSIVLEAVGDSITGGADVYITNDLFSAQSGWDVHQNALESYTHKAAKLLGAEYRAVQASGYGLVQNWSGDTTQNVPKLYPYDNYFRYNPDIAGYTEDRKFDFDPPADIVVVNLGTNDNASGVSGSTFKSAAKTFSQTIRTNNPNAKIVWVTGMRGDLYKSEMQAAVSELGGAASGYFFCQLPYGASAGNHPNADEHTAAAQVLVEFLKKNCLPEGYATVASTATLQAKINEAQNAPFTSAALTAAIEAAQMELSVGTTDSFRLGTRVDAIEAALNGELTGVSLMPNAKYSTYDTESNGGYNHVVKPTYNSDGTVKLTKSGTSSYWPRVDTKPDMAWNVKATPYLRVEIAGTAEWNASICYEDANGSEHSIAMAATAGNSSDYKATSTRQVVSVDLGSTILSKGYANADGFVRIKYIRFYVVGTNGVYVTLYDCSLSENNGTTWSGASDAASYISSANAVYVRKNNATLSGTIPSGAKVYTETGVNTLTFNGLTMSGATPAFTVKSNVKIKLTGTNTVTASTQFSGGTATYIGTGVLKNGSTVVMRKGDVDSSGAVNSSDIRAMMNHCAGISTLTSAKLKIADTEGDNAIDTRDVRRYLDTVVS